MSSSARAKERSRRMGNGDNRPSQPKNPGDPKPIPPIVPDPSTMGTAVKADLGRTTREIAKERKK
jgi:hypothetical protein